MKKFLVTILTVVLCCMPLCACSTDFSAQIDETMDGLYQTLYNSLELFFKDANAPDNEDSDEGEGSGNENAGENVGIVGKTGSGKTTIVDLILRVYNVPDGTLFVDGHDVNDVTISSLRRFMAYVPQDNFLFSDTIENNIAFASDDKDFERVISLRAMHPRKEQVPSSFTLSAIVTFSRDVQA